MSDVLRTQLLITKVTLARFMASAINGDVLHDHSQNS